MKRKISEILRDAIEPCSGDSTSKLFDPAVALEQNLLSPGIEDHLTSIGDQEVSRLDQLHQRFENLKSEKQVLRIKASTLIEQISSALLAYTESPAPAKAAQIAELQQQMEMLRNQLAKVELEIKDLMNEIEQIRAQESETTDSIKALSERERTILENLLKAAEAYSEITAAASLLE